MVLDYGSQYTQLIARRARELHIYSEILPGDATLARVQALEPRALILSGGPHSVAAEGAPTVAGDILQYCTKEKVPILGVCYGLQLIAQLFEGQVAPADKREYGRMAIDAVEGSVLFKEQELHQEVWMSHGDEIKSMPPGFKVVANSAQGAIVGIEDASRLIFGVQYHPEVAHTPYGKALLSHFLLDICKCEPGWALENVLEEEVRPLIDCMLVGE